MSYALVPGASISDAVAAGYALNLPLRVTAGGSGPAPEPLVSLDGTAARIYDRWFGPKSTAPLPRDFVIGSTK